MKAKLPRRVRLAKNRADNDRRFQRLRHAGMDYLSMWVPSRCVATAHQRATALGVHRQTVFRAALEVGLRHLTTSDVIRTAQAWKGIIGLPIAPRYPGEKADRHQRPA